MELNCKWATAASLLRYTSGGAVYLEDSVVRDLATYSSITEDVSIGVYLPHVASAEPLLKQKLPELFARIVEVLKRFSSIRSIRVAFTLDSATFDSEWQLFKNAAYFYDLNFTSWTLWVKVFHCTKTEKVKGKQVQVPCGFAQICEGSKVERRLAGHVQVLQEIAEKRAAAKKLRKAETKAYYVAIAKEQREKDKVFWAKVKRSEERWE